jgi:[ribosomal protein S5]-alanine N-acetyltransferase
MTKMNTRLTSIDLETDRLVLRRFQPGDEIDLYDYTGDADSSLFLQRTQHSDIQHTQQVLENWCHKKWQDGSAEFAWILGCKETNKALGLFFVFSNGHACEIHYGISKAFRGKGLIVEAGHAVVRHVLTHPFIQRIWTVCDVENHASRRVLEKLGFECEGTLRRWLMMPAFGDQARDCYCFSMTH